MPTKAEKKQLDGALATFHSHYSADRNWGTQRWESSLYEALAAPTRYAALINTFASTTEVDDMFSGLNLPNATLQQMQFPHARWTQPVSLKTFEYKTQPTVADDKVATANFLFPQPTPVSSIADPNRKVFSHWNLDAASVLCAWMLDVQPGDKVLDLCAAPGGKSVSLSQILFQGARSDTGVVSGCLHSNEMDPARNKRLAINLQSYLPRHLFEKGSVRVLRMDAADVKAVHQLPLGAGGYDRVLLDAPCSSERHIIHAHVKAASTGRIAEEMLRWRPGSSRNLAKIQAALLMTALRAVRVGGMVVYSTCSIDTGENDGVLEKVMTLLEQEHGKTGLLWTVRIETAPSEHSTLDEDGLDQWTERTKYGRIALPDHLGGGKWGPLFFAVITKINRDVAA
ncbi:hypothetical protein MBLNU457_g2969t1 [Dothideomycetes sp. NU457]